MAHQIIHNSLAGIKCNNFFCKGASRLTKFLAPPTFVSIQNRCRGGNKGKHWNPKFKRERKEKIQKIELPDYDKDRREKDLPVQDIKAKLKKLGIAPNRPWFEKPMHVSCLGSIVDAYVPPEGDAKATITSGPGMKSKVDSIGKKGKSYMALRKIRGIDYEFDVPTIAEKAKEIYIEAQTALAKYDEDKLHELVTEKAYPEITENVRNKVIKYKYIQALDHPRIVHIRTQELENKENLFAQITVRLFTQETLAIYDRFGRLMHGSEDVLKDNLQYIVFEKHLTDMNGTWRIHGKIIPDWLPPREPIKRTYFLPPMEIPAPSGESKTAEISDSKTAEISESKTAEISQSKTKQIESVKQ